MEKPLLVAALVCEPGDRLINLSSNIPRGMRSMDFVVSLRPFCVLHAVLHLQPGFPDIVQQCCNGKLAAVLRMPIVDGRFCVRQSQPQMKWNVRALLRPDIEM
jgi:hypothetical protein